MELRLYLLGKAGRQRVWGAKRWGALKRAPVYLIYLPSLALFSEVWEAQTFRRLMFTLVSCARDDEHYDCYNIREHLIELFYCEVHACRNEEI